MSLENVEMWFHKNIDPIARGKRSILKHIETVRNSSWVIFFTLIFPDWNLLTWRTNAIFAWQLHAEPRVLWKLECCQYFNAWNINDWQVKKTFSWKKKSPFFKACTTIWKISLFHRIQFDLQKGYRKLWCLPPTL